MSSVIKIRIFLRKQKICLIEGLKFTKIQKKFEKSIGETVKLKNQKDNFSKKPEQKVFIEYIENKSKTIDYNLFKKHLNFESPTVLTKQLYKIKKKKENNKLVNVIKSGLIDFKNEIKKMSEDEKETEKPGKIL